MVVGDPSYFPDKCRRRGKVVRAIALLSQPLPNTNDAPSCQVIFPAAQVNRTNDLYLFCCGASHKVAPQSRYVAFLSSNVEGECDGMSAEQVAQRELNVGLNLLTNGGGVVRIFYDVYELLVPNSDGDADRVFISESFDPTSHFETAINDVLAMYKRITGSDLVLEEGA
eukprot:1489160-Pleurochrysis_carterae.AAC.4